VAAKGVKVQMVVSISGTRGGADWPPAGEVLEVTAEEAAQLCAGGLAVPVDARDDDVETATPPKAETRAKK
jgi:hypothetical protein